MIGSNIKSKSKGFTIVELLVVIVVIGILAAITIVSYVGITARANTQANKANAASVVASIETYYADKQAYPAWTTDSATTITAINNGNSAKLPATIVLQNSAVSAATTNMGYVVKGTGMCISYWDYTIPGVQYLPAGGVTCP